jgi:GNAT superfamily N-acetyltransferase
MTAVLDADLYLRGTETVLASWEAYAAGSRGAAVVRLPGVAAAVFPAEPERSVYNNAVLAHGLGPVERAEAVDAVEAAYASAGVPRFAAWVHETDRAMRADLEARGYRIDTATRAMGMAVGDVRLPRPRIDLAPPDWSAYLRLLVRDGAPPGLLDGVDPGLFSVPIARLDGEDVAAALAFDLGDDRGIYNVGTLPHARRRGLGTALTALLVHDAADRGFRTATLQSTPMGEHVYAAVGFRDVGRILEYVPATGRQVEGTRSAAPKATENRSHQTTTLR